jgi:glycosyltransferase involved in cell wall biosynthesis
MNNTKVSIVIACYNDAQYIGKSVQSALNQTYPNKEIIVVDDGSNEETKAVLKKLESQITKLITQVNQGQSIARNNGIKVATGDYILNLDSDDFFEPTFCQKAIAEFQKDDEIKIVTCHANRFVKTGNIDVFVPNGGGLNNFLFSNSALGSSMFRRKDWETTGGYEERLPVLGFEDWEFYIQILKLGGYCFVINETLFNYQMRDGSITKRIRYEKLNKYNLIIKKHKELYIENFDSLIENFIYRLEREEFEKIKNTQRLEFRIGKNILKPLRWIKSIFK